MAVGLLLSTLYGIAGSIPWYGIYLFAVHFVALAVFTYLVLADDRGGLPYRLLALAAYVAVFDLQLATAITYTSAALLLGIAGVLLSFSRQTTARGSRVAAVVAGVLVGASSLVRWEAMGLVVVLALPFLALGARRIPWRRQTLFAAVAAGVIVLGSAFQTGYYAGDEAWNEYFEFHDVREGVMEQSDWANDQALLADLGWSRNDAAMFLNHFYLDEAVFSIDRLRLIANEAEKRGLSAGAITGAFDAQTDSPTDVKGLLLVGVLLATTWAAGGRRTRGFAAGVLLWGAGVSVALVAFRKLPSRVGFPIIAFVALMLLISPTILAPDSARHSRSRWCRFTVLLAAPLAVALVVMGMIDVTSNANREAGSNLGGLMADLKAIDPDGVFVSWGGQLGLNRLPPLAGGRTEWPSLIPLGWFARSPMHEAWLARHGIDDLYTAIALRDDVYLPLLDGASQRNRYLTYLKEHYGFVGLLRPVSQVGAFTVYSRVVAYAIDDSAGALLERHLDGTVTEFPLVGTDSGMRGDVTIARKQDSLGLVGVAADTSRGGPVDLIVVMRGGEAVALVLPAGRDPGVSAAWGLSGQTPVRFSVSLNGNARHIRVFALSAGHAAEIVAHVEDA